ncbi:VCBS repeat-containing protein [candidate division KSB1 bacterium]|nr:VCBS repeat-containing protein [candidate division KSB1 bacterium]
MLWPFSSSHFMRGLLLVHFLICASQGIAQPQPVIVNGFPLRLDTDSRLKALEGPALADLDRDGKLEIIVASGKKVYAFHHDGKPSAGWPQTTTYSTTNSPAVGDIDNDGNLDIATFDREGFTRSSFLYAWDHRGNLLPGFPVAPGFGDYALTLYDLNGDGKLEIIGSFGDRIFVFQHDGSVASGWPQPIPGFYPSTKASIGDINADGIPEIVVAAQLKTSINENFTGRIYVWKTNGELLKGWPVETAVGYTYAGWCNPALADVNNDGFLEIAVGTYSFVRPNRVAYVALYRYDGTMMPGWPQFTAGRDSLNSIGVSPAFADLNGDDKPDLILGDIWDHVMAWNGDGTAVSGWPVIYGDLDTSLTFRSTIVANPTAGDLDGDGDLEIMANNNQADLVAGVWLGRIYAFNHDATPLPWSPLRPREFASMNSVAMADLEGDGLLNLVTVSLDDETWLTVWEIPGVPYVKERFPWPMYGHDRWHTSQYGFKPPDEPTAGVKEREERDQLPKAFELHQNYPNPFYGAGASLRGSRNRTEISYQLPIISHVELRLFNLLGEEVRRLVNATQAPGTHRVQWDGRDERGNELPVGIYSYRMQANPQNRNGESVSFIKKLLMVK